MLRESQIPFDHFVHQSTSRVQEGRHQYYPGREEDHRARGHCRSLRRSRECPVRYYRDQLRLLLLYGIMEPEDGLAIDTNIYFQGMNLPEPTSPGLCKDPD
jgi:hypothetical protein